MDREGEIQRFYFKNRCVEYVLSYDEAISLITSISRRLPACAKTGRDISLLLALNPTPTYSVCFPRVLTDRVLVAIDVISSDPSLARRTFLYDEPLSVVADYFNI
jgi:hypothetical protein